MPAGTDTQIDTSAPTENLGPTLRAMRVGSGLTQTELAKRVQSDKSTISRFEAGERRPSLELLAQIARVIADECNARRAETAA